MKPPPVPSRAKETAQIVDVDGVAVHVEGEGGDTIVMVHGWPDTYRLWDAQVAALRASHRCVRFTLPGFDAARSRHAYSLAEIEAVYERVIEAVSPASPVVLMVHDWGAVFGYRFVQRRPDRVHRLIGVDIGDAGSKRHLATLGLRGKLMVAAYQLWLAAAWRIGPTLGDPMTKALVRLLPGPADAAGVSSGMNYPYWIQWSRARGGYPPLESFTPACPMLFIYGERKPFMFHSDAWATEIAGLPGCSVVPLPAGHWVMSDAPQAFNDVVERWLSDRR